MLTAAAIIVAILPGLLFCYLLAYVVDVQREAYAPLLLCFALGILVTLPVMFIQTAIADYGFEETKSLGNIFLSAFLLIALCEETFKFLGFIFPYNITDFDEPIDGVVFVGMLSMGFATTENVLYAYEMGIATAITRGLTAVPIHAAIGVITTQTAQLWLTKGFFVAVLTHGIYDFFIIQNIHEYLMLGALVWLLLIGYWAYVCIRELRVVPTTPPQG